MIAKVVPFLSVFSAKIAVRLDGFFAIRGAMTNHWDFRCFHCEAKLALANHAFCSRCLQTLANSAYCGHCGANLLENATACGECLKNEPKWHKMVRVASYQKPLSHWIHLFKFERQYWLDQGLARLLLLAVQTARREHHLRLPEVLMPVPLFPLRHWQRGYNQAELVARPLAQWLNIPLDTTSLQRIKHTPPQRELSASKRRHNLRNAFRYQPCQDYQRVAIIDDVVTTGSTLNEISLLLLKQGVKEIQVWTLGRR